ncbi:MAG: DUF362 domain-containing protein [Candidatus Eisenbacteria bacterium]|nr:DUF362 domain-containing protein [Candidatus Eisenbacteria bacterium]
MPEATAEVHFLRCGRYGADDIAGGLDRLLDESRIGRVVREGDIAAIKMHFGESKETGHVRPHLVRRVVSWLARRGARPFVTDTNTLYRGSRSDSVMHLRTAAEHGFTQQALDAPVMIADGMRGTSEVRLRAPGDIVGEAPFGAELVKADSIISVAHFKGHELSGFGGAIKNLGMGGASRAGKLDQHSTTKPYVREGCVGCGTCARWCPVEAIAVAEEASIDETVCIGCGECIAVCPQKSIGIRWDESTDIFQRKMVEYLGAIATLKTGRVAYVNFITDVHPVCDCYGKAKTAITPDVGVLASLDPVAIDQASYDLVNAGPVAAGSDLSPGYRAGEDKFRDLHQDVDATVQLRYAERLGLGTRDYVLLEVNEERP